MRGEWREVAKNRRRTINFYHPNLTLNLPADFDNAENGLPQRFVNDFWKLTTGFIRINSSTSNVTMHLDIGWIHPLKHDGLEDFDPLDPGTDCIKVDEIFLHVNPVTMLVVIVGSCLRILNDIYLITKIEIQFNTGSKVDETSNAKKAKPKKARYQPSIQETIFAAFQSLVVCLYLLEYSEDMLGRMSVITSFLLHFVDWLCDDKWDGCGSDRRFRSKKAAEPEEEEEKKAQLDPTVEKILLLEAQTYWLATCLSIGFLLCQSLWFLLFGGSFQEEISLRSVYRFSLHEFYSALLTFDLIMQTPQLIDNYRFKTVPYASGFALARVLVHTFLTFLTTFLHGSLTCPHSTC
ncbi:unnamed protein product, partial [Mesorhabditis belari]|uniref:Uncharacterized protein n=1 Tax=Mesorhabditis belari TaxID=2138241 RepID=A0AAF3ENH7_9BILA